MHAGRIRRRSLARIGPFAAALATSAVTGPGLAEDHYCGSGVDPAEHAALAALERTVYAQGPPQGGISGVNVVAVTFHIVRQSDGSGGLDPLRLLDFLDDLNDGFADASIGFCQPGPTDYIDSDALYFDIDSDAEINLLRQVNTVADTINIYFTANLAGDNGSLCGRSSFTSSSVQGIAMKNTCQGTSEIGGVLVHEVGHYFNLYHTHETQFGIECPDGSNCNSAGDLVCDTPADYNLDFDSCVDANCDVTCSVPAPCGSETYDPDPTNFMSYSRTFCLADFTAGQNGRALTTLVNLRPELLGTCTAGNLCGTGAGSCISANGTPGCSDPACCQLVCSIDPFCCESQWDSICAALGEQNCGCGTPGAGDCFSVNGTPACDDADCCSAVCVIAPECCNFLWDVSCAVVANLVCNAAPGEECLSSTPISDGAHPVSTDDNGGLNPADGSCGSQMRIDEWYEYTPTCDGVAVARICALLSFPSLEIPEFALSVFGDCAGSEIACSNVGPNCTFEPQSAEVAWSVTAGSTYLIRLASPPDATGAGTLEIGCGGCGLAGSGACDVANGTIGCEDGDCCAAVCAVDAYCCTTAWDGICASQAASICGVCPADLDGDQQVATSDLLALLGSWGACGSCPADFDGNGSVDTADLLALLAAWGPCNGS